MPDDAWSRLRISSIAAAVDDDVDDEDDDDVEEDDAECRSIISRLCCIIRRLVTSDWIPAEL